MSLAGGAYEANAFRPRSATGKQDIRRIEPAAEDTHTEKRKIVAMDIETTGLNMLEDSITVICFYGNIYHRDQTDEAVFNLMQTQERSKMKLDIATILDNAECITCYNGATFDIPFIQHVFGFENSRVGQWYVKLFDVLEISRTLLKAAFKLDQVLLLNDLQTKSSSGLQAIEWAKNKIDWPKLIEYCMEDTRLTFMLSKLPIVRLPVKHSSGFYCILRNGAGFRIDVL
jgi:DNA polymerase elongation subunit (family B)